MYEAADTDENGARPHAAEAGVERGKLLARAGEIEAAITAYLQVVEAHPASEEAAFAAYWAAVLTEQQGSLAQATDLYQQLATNYPAYEDAPRALFRVGLLNWEAGDEETAVTVWQQLVNTYPERAYGAAGLIWLMRVLPPVEAEPYAITATQLSAVDYYPLRARERAESEEPFARAGSLVLESDDEAERLVADEWLQAQFGLEGGINGGTLSPELAEDERLVRGSKLWQLGLFEAAKRELEAIRTDYDEEPLATYELALYFRDLGLYRSSILAAETLLKLADSTVLEAPRLIGRLAYPIYYHDLVLPLAAEYGYDPLLQFSLIRQESLFESFVASYAGAQGLSQVMPATGADIARRLEWPEYANEDLYRPYVGLAFGAYYLAEQLSYFDGSVYAALSAYNAGPGNAARWYAEAGDDPDLYLETVDYRETRLYIQRIYTGFVVYRYLYSE
jgi:soluble lytic murein transglycosylase